MINKDLERFIEGKCPFEVTNGQREMIAMTADFLLSGDKDGLCLWRGYAGTGKTSVLSGQGFGRFEAEIRPDGTYGSGGQSLCPACGASGFYHS